MDKLSKALSTMLTGVDKQLEYALNEKLKIAKNIAEQKLLNLQKKIKEQTLPLLIFVFQNKLHIIMSVVSRSRRNHEK
ncbi:MAG: hypothetical protein ACI9XC_000865 [Gammaproteobacteria bacterium]|jgi:hypothetical protein